MKIIIRLYNKENKVIKRLIGNRENWRRLHAKLASAVAHKWFVDVHYGYKTDVFGKRVLFKNTGTYTNLKDAKQALSAFIEE